MYFSQHYQSLKRLLIGLFLHGFNQMLSYSLSVALSKVTFVVYYKTGSPVSVQEKPEQPHPAESSQNQSPETGDHTPLSFWIILLLLSSAGVLAAAYIKCLRPKGS